jgi:hypothetical protein
MGSSGVVISLVAEMEKFKLQSIARYYGITRTSAACRRMKRSWGRHRTRDRPARVPPAQRVNPGGAHARFKALARTLAQSEKNWRSSRCCSTTSISHSACAAEQPAAEIREESAPPKPRPRDPTEDRIPATKGESFQP